MSWGVRLIDLISPNQMGYHNAGAIYFVYDFKKSENFKLCYINSSAYKMYLTPTKSFQNFCLRIFVSSCNLISRNIIGISTFNIQNKHPGR